MPVSDLRSTISRAIEPHVTRCAGSFPAVAIVGPRQSGKSVLARHAFPGHRAWVLESPDVAAFARADPRGFLAKAPSESGAILDEIQRVPELLSYLLEVIDANRAPGRWILTGSESLQLSSGISQSLAGRVAMLELLPMDGTEVARLAPGHGVEAPSLDHALLAGGYPPIHAERLDPVLWLSNYVATYLERDVRSVLRLGDLNAFRRFMALCAGRTGQLLNVSALAADAGVSAPTARSWISVLEATFVLALLPAWHGNVRKRLVKSPKLHMLDSGLTCSLLGIRSTEHLSTHPLRGPMFESWVVAESMKAQANAGQRHAWSHWRDQSGLEIDLMVETPRHRVGIEVKAGATFQREWLDPILRWSSTFDDASKPPQPKIVCGVEPHQAPTDVISWRSWPASVSAMMRELG